MHLVIVMYYDGYGEMKMKIKLLPYCNGQVILSLFYGDGYGVHGYIYVNCISVTHGLSCY